MDIENGNEQTQLETLSEWCKYDKGIINAIRQHIKKELHIAMKQVLTT